MITQPPEDLDGETTRVLPVQASTDKTVGIIQPGTGMVDSLARSRSGEVSQGSAPTIGTPVLPADTGQSAIPGESADSVSITQQTSEAQLGKDSHLLLILMIILVIIIILAVAAVYIFLPGFSLSELSSALDL